MQMLCHEMLHISEMLVKHMIFVVYRDSGVVEIQIVKSPLAQNEKFKWI